MASLKLSDETLVQRIRSGDENAFEILYDKYSAAINGVVSKILHDDEKAEDVLQDAFVKVWTNIKDYNSAKGSIFTWILNIARNRAIDKLRIKSNVNEIRNTVSNVDYRADNYQEKMMTDTIGIKDLLDKLNPDQKMVMEFAYFQGYTQEEIAEKLNLPLGTVKTRTRMALQELRKLVD